MTNPIPKPTTLLGPVTTPTPRRWIAITAYQRDARRAVAYVHVRGIDGEETLGSGVQIVPAYADGPQKQFALDQFEAAYRDAENAGETLYVVARVGDLHNHLQVMADSLPNMRVVEVITRGTISERTHTKAHALTVEALDEDDRIHRPITVVATDASKQIGRAGAGMAAVTADGRARMQYDPSYTDILSAELGAMRLALREYRGKRIVIESDSQHGVDLANRMMSGDLKAIAQLMSGDLPSEAKRALRSIARHAQNREITIRWVRGHQDHQLNLAADRLAVLARRSGGGTDAPADVVQQIAANILDEHLPADVVPHLALVQMAPATSLAA